MIIPPPPFQVPPPPINISPSTTSSSTTTTPLPPPPPPQLPSSSIADQRKKKKRFKLVPPSDNQVPLSNPSIPKPPLHISFGGSSFELGYQKTLLMLDLDPATKYSQDGGLDTSFEFDWKPIQTENNQVFDESNFTCMFGNIIYSKRNQAIYVFGRGWSKPWIAELSLKTLKWKKKDVSINHVFPSVKYAVSQDSENFLLCMEGDYYNNPPKLSMFKFSELERIFSKQEKEELLLGDRSCFTLNGNFQARMTAPLSNENKTKIISNCPYIGEPVYPCATELMNDSNSKCVLISSGDKYFNFNVDKRTPKSLRYSKSAIEMNYHKLFVPYLAYFKTRRGENQVVHIINNDILLILKLDNIVPTYAFNNKLTEAHFSDVIVECNATTNH
ncbi:predicted protein [Naegleria gruberi]|uniref:Predicted protein n=1 Tax=Naegleria gruberi TaxID=5762 RepID=D2VJW3_NAEGR|nr:uncharacterized protein NAEGRDRAFT_69183 [Naegleria gruberi]EFC42760.1 predicted protein [Naegleria gruberi]|eukprot:XP_002675504.1 predicted protein [Naegleria gruberi strain NEG-M]